MQQATDLQRIPNGQTRELAPLAEHDGFQPLDVYAGGATSDAGQLPILAQISAGDRDAKTNYPRVSRDGSIILHDPEGRAPGLAERLKAGDGKILTVAFPWHERGKFISQRFKRYTASRLEVYGDGRSITEILTHEDTNRKGETYLVADGHRSHLHGSEEYARLVATCKVETRILFLLAAWDGDRPRLEWPDGLGVYALRTTSRHTINSLLGTLQLINGWTGGRIAGVPFELRLSYPEVARPTGEKAKVPVWQFTFKPPVGLSLTGRSFRELVGGALAEAEAMQLRALPAASEETLETAEIVDPEPEELLRASQGDVANESYWIPRWHAQADGTWLDDREERRQFLLWVTAGRFESLARFLGHATNEEADGLIAAAAEALAVAGIQTTAEWAAWCSGRDELDMAPEPGTGPDAEPEPTRTAEAGVASGETTSASTPAGSATPLPAGPGTPEPVAEIDVFLASQAKEEKRLAREAVTDQPKFDPLHEAADAAIKALRAIAGEHKTGKGINKLTLEQRDEMVALLAGFGMAMAGGSVNTFCIRAFGAPINLLHQRHLTAVQAVADAQNGKQMFDAIVANLPHERGLV